ncbi:MAG: glutamate-cysteine ligase family protein, partial [Candidatus Natronoplasma sp.]
VEDGSSLDLKHDKKGSKAADLVFCVDEYKTVYARKEDSYHKISSSSADAERKALISKAKTWITASDEVEREDLKIKNIFHEKDRTQILLTERERTRDHLLMMERDFTIKRYRRIEDSSFLLPGEENQGLTRLPFTHGIEMELQVVKKNWDWVEGGQMAIVFQEILNDSRRKIAGLRNTAEENIQKKWKDDVVIKEDDKGYEAVHIKYSVGGEQEYYSVLGKDSHVTFKTNILEVQTPPCEYLEELEWWVYHLYRIAHEVVKDLNIDADIIPVGTNPVEEYSEGLSFGEHHHVGIEDLELRKEVYNTYRYLIPHFIALSSNSPFLGDKGPSSAFNDLGNLVITDPSYNMRLKNNVEQFRVPPYLPYAGEEGKAFFKEELGRTDKSARMIDIYPFTRYDTIEVRIFDTQLTTMDRISIALLLQAVALHVKERFEEGDGGCSPKISSSLLKKNRDQSIEDGMLGRMYSEEDFDLTGESGHGYLYKDCRALLKGLYPRFKELGVEDTSHLKNLLLKVFSMEDQHIAVEPPISPSQLLIFRSGETDSSLEAILDELRLLSQRAAEDMRYDLWSKYMDIGEMDISDFEGFPPEQLDDS